ncbi:MAG: hypothetical protein ABIQ11_11245 [Saprospiraceae bacterium]
MIIQGKLKKRSVGLRSKTPRTELFVTYRKIEYILKSPLTTTLHPDPDLLKLENKKVKLKGYVITGTNLFNVTDVKIMEE